MQLISKTIVIKRNFKSPVMVAALNGMTAILETLLHHGAEIDQENK